MTTSITAEEYVRKEFENFEDMSHEDWLRKMREYSVIQSSKVNLDYVQGLRFANKPVFRAIQKASEALHFNDNSDYKNTLYGVLQSLCDIAWDDLTDETVKSIFYLTQD